MVVGRGSNSTKQKLATNERKFFQVHGNMKKAFDVKNMQVAKPICICDACVSVTKMSLEQQIADIPEKLRSNCARLVVWLCKQVLASSMVGFRFDRDHSFFGRSDPLNVCQGGMFLRTVKRVCRELGIHVTVFASMHVSLYESYYVALPNDEADVDTVKANAVALAGHWHALALGWEMRDLAQHIQEQNRINRQRIEKIKADPFEADEGELVLQFVEQMDILLPKFKYIYEYDYELTQPVGKRVVAPHCFLALFLHVIAMLTKMLVTLRFCWRVM